MRPNSIDSVFERIAKTPSGCWIWLGNTAPNGYGLIRYHGKYFGAHVMAHWATKGPIPKDRQIDHLCFVRNCVNPDHLEIVTAQENQRRALKRRFLCKNGMHYLNGLTVCAECRKLNRKRHYNSPKYKEYQRRWQAAYRLRRKEKTNGSL